MTTTIESTYQFITLSSFSKLSFWDYYTLSNKASIFSNFPLVELNSVLKQRKETIIIDNSEIYKRCRVQLYGNGVILRDPEGFEGEKIKTKKQQLCKTNDFLVAEIDAKFGGYGIVPEELEGAIVSSHYFLFEIDTRKLLPEFLGLVIKCNDFSKQVKATGSTNYAAIRPYHVLSYLIPLPSLEVQNQIVQTYNDRISEAERLEEEAKGLEEGIEKYLFDVLGINYNKQSSKKLGLNFVSFSETNRWDILYLIGNLLSYKSNFKQIKMGTVISRFIETSDGKSLRINTTEYPENKFRFIGMEHIEKETGVLSDFTLSEGKKLKSQTVKVPKGYILFGKLRPYLNKYWINETDYDNIVCSSEFFVFSIDDRTIDKRYFKYILSSRIIQEQIADKSSGARMPRINEDIFMNLIIPLPPIEIQLEIANRIDLIRKRINTLRQYSSENRQQAISEFESKIFMPCN